MNKTRWSLAYLAFYTTLIGLGGIFFSDKMLVFLGSNNHYGDVAPKMVGVLIVSIGIITAQAVRYNEHKLFPTLLWFRILVGVTMFILYFTSHDPMFLVVFAIGGVGVLITSICFYLETSK